MNRRIYIDKPQGHKSAGENLQYRFGERVNVAWESYKDMCQQDKLATVPDSYTGFKSFEVCL